jgi:hypothetical protein
VRWDGEGTVRLVDEGAVVTSHLSAVGLRDARDGALRWTARPDPESCWPVALGPQVVVVARGGINGSPVLFTTLDRETGAVRGELGALDGRGRAALAGARGVLYVVREGSLLAVEVDGATLWELPAAALGGAAIHSLLPAPGRLYAKAADGTVTCLGA